MKTKATDQRKNENPPQAWLPEACHYGSILGSNKIIIHILTPSADRIIPTYTALFILRSY